MVVRVRFHPAACFFDALALSTCCSVVTCMQAIASLRRTHQYVLPLSISARSFLLMPLEMQVHLELQFHNTVIATLACMTVFENDAFVFACVYCDAWMRLTNKCFVMKQNREMFRTPGTTDRYVFHLAAENKGVVARQTFTKDSVHCNICLLITYAKLTNCYSKDIAQTTLLDLSSPTARLQTIFGVCRLEQMGLIKTFVSWVIHDRE